MINLASPFADISVSDSLLLLATEAQRREINVRDVYGSGAQWLVDLEARVASLTCKEAAIYVPSGIMAQQIALAIYREEAEKADGIPSTSINRSFVAHTTSHLLLHEHNSFEHLLKISVTRAGQREFPLSYSDVI